MKIKTLRFGAGSGCKEMDVTYSARALTSRGSEADTHTKHGVRTRTGQVDTGQ